MATSWLSRMRFSILSLVLFTALIAIVISYFNMPFKLRYMQEELTKARKELAYLDTAGTNEIYAVALPTFEPMQWRWRIQLPNKGNYSVRYAFDQIPIEDYPKATGTDSYIFLDKTGKQLKGPFILTIAVHQNEAGDWVLTNRVDGIGDTAPIIPTPTWLNAKSFVNWQTDVRGLKGTESSKQTECLTLLRYRKCKVSPGRASIDMQPCDGMIFWVEGQQ